MTSVAGGTSEFVKVTCVVHHITALALDRAAERAGIGRGDAIRNALDDWIKKIEEGPQS